MGCGLGTILRGAAQARARRAAPGAGPPALPGGSALHALRLSEQAESGAPAQRRPGQALSSCLCSAGACPAPRGAAVAGSVWAALVCVGRLEVVHDGVRLFLFVLVDQLKIVLGGRPAVDARVPARGDAPRALLLRPARGWGGPGLSPPKRLLAQAPARAPAPAAPRRRGVARGACRRGCARAARHARQQARAARSAGQCGRQGRLREVQAGCGAQRRTTAARLCAQAAGSGRASGGRAGREGRGCAHTQRRRAAARLCAQAAGPGRASGGRAGREGGGCAHIRRVPVDDLQALDGEDARPRAQRLRAAAVLADDAARAAAHLALAGEDVVQQPVELRVDDGEGGDLHGRRGSAGGAAERTSCARLAPPRAVSRGAGRGAAEAVRERAAPC